VTTPLTTAENADPSTIEETAAFTPKFNAEGLIPAIATAAATGEVLMFAYMNGEALARTLETGEAHFWSRSRGKLWRKGEESGNTMRVVELRTDCDQDALWLRVEMGGARAGCHTGRRSCFYRAVPLGGSPGEGVTLRFVDGERVSKP